MRITPARKMWRFSLFSLIMVLAVPAWCEIKLPHVFGSHMVLQRGKEIPIWGWGLPGETVQIQLAGQAPLRVEAGVAGDWGVVLPSVEAGGPLTLTVTGSSQIVLEDILVGEVWIASGQSNMEWPVLQSVNGEQEVAQANWPQIRLFGVPKKAVGFPCDDVEATWQVCSPETVKGFSACAYFFGRQIHQALQVPVGLINSSWGGTRIEPWTPPVGFEPISSLQSIHQQVILTDPHSEAYKARLTQYLQLAETWVQGAKQALEDETPLNPSPGYPGELVPLTEPRQPCTLFNGMIHPLVPFAFRGALWYQGESNHGEGDLYTDKMKALVEGWRATWGQGDFPFYYVQIAPFDYNNEDPNILAQFWVSQAKAQSIPNTGMVVVNDIADVKDIHPKNKQEVGRRLALWALAKTYGQDSLCATGPTVRSMSIERNTIRVSFDHAASGLASRDGKPLTWFEVIGKDTDFVPALAVIDKDSVIVSSPDVPNPVAARFAWHRNAEPNLMNSEGLPAGAFTVGDIPDRDMLTLKVPEAKEYVLVYSLDLGKVGPEIVYDVDRRASIIGSFDRIAYFIELQRSNESEKYLYVSMDAFTEDLAKIGVPTVASEAVFQQNVTQMNVWSNVEGIATGTGCTGGNIEFWPHNYGTGNVSNIPNASSDVYDFGDQRSDPVDGHGCMQVHNHEAQQTLFALNAWKAKDRANLGIGNSQGKTRDWTFEENAGDYALKKLRILVRPR